MEPTTASYPVSFTFDPPEHIARWRPLVAWLLVIPHFVVLYFVQIVASVCVVHRRGSRSSSPASCPRASPASR